MSVQLTTEETKFLMETRLPESEEDAIALLWSYWSTTDIPIFDLIQRAKQIRENGYKLRKE